jgi:uncharacterized membrane protein YkoI
MKKCLILTVLAVSAAVFAADLKEPEKKCCEVKCEAKSECKAGCKKGKCAEAKKYIGKKAAIDAALSHAGLKRSEVRDLQCELDRENDIMVYEVEFESGLYDYEYDIDATTGKVLKSKKELD